MNCRSKKIACVALFLLALNTLTPLAARAENVLVVADEVSTVYQRSLFKLWIDEDRNGCNTRSEVLIAEAIAKPKIGKNCALTGGSWLSPYDNKVQTQASALDIDHLVPLAEAWRSGAWKWTAAQRQAYANDLRNKEVLVAVTLSLNRAKGDKDIANWLPPFGQCSYARDWIVVKLTYGLTVDLAEANKLRELIKICGISGVTIGNESPTPTPSASPSQVAIKSMPTPPTPILESKTENSVTITIPNIPDWDFQIMTLTLEFAGQAPGDCQKVIQISTVPTTITCKNLSPRNTWVAGLYGNGDYRKVKPTFVYSKSLIFDTFNFPTPSSSTFTTSTPNPTPSASNSTVSTPSPTPSPTPAATLTRAPSPTPTSTSTITWPQDSSARCKDGTFSYSKTRSGTCSGHGGVDTWRNP